MSETSRRECQPRFRVGGVARRRLRQLGCAPTNAVNIATRRAQRHECNVSNKSCCPGVVGRLSPQKRRRPPPKLTGRQPPEIVGVSSVSGPDDPLHRLAAHLKSSCSGLAKGSRMSRAVIYCRTHGLSVTRRCRAACMCAAGVRCQAASAAIRIDPPEHCRHTHRAQQRVHGVLLSSPADTLISCAR